MICVFVLRLLCCFSSLLLLMIFEISTVTYSGLGRLFTAYEVPNQALQG